MMNGVRSGFSSARLRGRFEAGAFLLRGGRTTDLAAGEGFYRDYVPDVDGHQVGDYTSISRAVRRHFVLYVHVGVDGVAAMALVLCGADLGAQSGAGVEDKVVAVAVPPAGYAEAEGYGFVHEASSASSPRRLEVGVALVGCGTAGGAGL